MWSSPPPRSTAASATRMSSTSTARPSSAAPTPARAPARPAATSPALRGGCRQPVVAREFAECHAFEPDRLKGKLAADNRDDGIAVLGHGHPRGARAEYRPLDRRFVDE